MIPQLKSAIKKIIDHYLGVFDKRFVTILLQCGAFFIWIYNVLGVITTQNFNGNLTFDLFMARVSATAKDCLPNCTDTGNHVVTYLIFLSIFPISWAMIKRSNKTREAIVFAFLIMIYGLELHEGLWQIPYLAAWGSQAIDFWVWAQDLITDTIYTLVVVAILIKLYQVPKRFFLVTTLAWGAFLAWWYSVGFPVTILSKLPEGQIIVSKYVNVLWVNQIEFAGWAYFTIILLLSLALVLEMRFERFTTKAINNDIS